MKRKNVKTQRNDIPENLQSKHFSSMDSHAQKVLALKVFKNWKKQTYTRKQERTKKARTKKAILFKKNQHMYIKQNKILTTRVEQAILNSQHIRTVRILVGELEVGVKSLLHFLA
jgi:hypothetical protein